MNNRTKGYCLPVGRNYGVLTHEDAFGVVSRAIERHHLDVTGNVEVWNSGNSASLKFYIDGVELIKENGNGGIKPGFGYTNHYGQKMAFRGNGHFMRLVCTNGMRMRTLLPEFALKEFHLQDIAINLGNDVEKYMVNLMAKCHLIEGYISAAKTKSVTFKDEAERTRSVQFLVGTDKHGSAIDTRLKKGLPEPKLTASPWDVYSAITEYVSHEPSLSPAVQDKLYSVSEMIMRPAYQMRAVPAQVA
jgi:hypothetical protein